MAGASGSVQLLPPSLQDTALADQWMDWATSTLWPEWSFVFKSIVRTPPEQRSWPQIRDATQRLGKIYAVFDGWLGRNKYAAGETFTMGDIPIGATCYRYFELPIERPRLPNLERWYERLQGRTAYASTVMIPFGTTDAEWLTLEREGANHTAHHTGDPLQSN